MKLFYKELVVGTIEALSIEGLWVTGNIILNKDGEKFRLFFDYITNEKRGWEKPPFDADLLADENWTVEEASGRRGISLPAISLNGTISWRWR